MRSKFTLLLLVLNLGVFGYILFSERPWSATEKIDENRRRVLGPEAADVASLEISATADGASDAPRVVRLERRAGTWFLAAPLDWPANDFAVRRILNELQFLENETSFPVADLARNGQTLADYGLDHPRLVVTATPSAQTTSQSKIDNGSPSKTPVASPFILKIGATAAVGGRLYMLSPDGGRIHVVAPSIASALDLDLAQLRSDQLFTIPVFEARALSLQSGAANSARTRLRRDQSRWVFEAPITTRAAKTPVELAVNDLNALRVARFIPAENAPSAETTGLAAPRLRVTLEGNARRETLQLGLPASPAGADSVELYARLDWRAVASSAERPVLFTVNVPTALLATLEQAQTSLREKHILDLDAARVTGLAVSSPGLPDLRIQKLDSGVWQIAAPSAPLRADPAVVGRLLQRLQLLEAVRFASDAPSRPELENLGFNRPDRVVALQLASPQGPPSEIVLELAQPGGGDAAVYARVNGQPFVYAVPADTLEQIPVAARFYRDRSIISLPDTTKITRLVIRSAGAPDSAPLLDHTVSDSPPPAAVAALLSSVRDLRAKAIVREDYPSTIPVDGVEKPWAYTLEATLDPAGSSGPLTLSLGERAGGATQLAGSASLGLVFTLEQPVLDALWTLLYRAPAEPAPAP